MSLTRKEVEHIAHLARLELSKDEIEQYRIQLSAILEHVAALSKLDTKDITPTSSVLPERSRLRKDKIIPGLSTEKAMRNAPQKEDDQFRVPPVMDSFS